MVRVDEKAGSWRYSGGGYTLLQLLIEEVSGEPFADYMQRTVLAPLGMTRSTYRAGAPGAGDVAEFFDVDGGSAPPRITVTRLLRRHRSTQRQPIWRALHRLI